MKNNLLLILFVAIATLMGCSKSGDNPEPDDKFEDKYTLEKVSFGRNVVGVNQTVICKVDDPEWIGNVVTYKWEFTNPNGEKGSITTDVNQAILSPLLVGKYKVEVFVSSKGIEASSD